jgi:hypothetical protein
VETPAKVETNERSRGSVGINRKVVAGEQDLAIRLNRETMEWQPIGRGFRMIEIQEWNKRLVGRAGNSIIDEY